MMPSFARFVLAALVAAGCTRSEPARAPLDGEVQPEWGHPQPGDPAPPLTLRSLKGSDFSLESSRGSWVLVHFVETWRASTDDEASNVGRIADEYRARGLVVALVDVKDPIDLWRAYAHAHVPESVVTLHDEIGTMAARYAPPGAAPSLANRSEAVLGGSVLIDPKGLVRIFVLPDASHLDASFQELEEALDSLLPGASNSPHGADVAESPRSAVSSNENVVQVSQMAAVPVIPGGHGVLEISLDVAEGFHVMSDRPTRPTYVATIVDVDRASMTDIAFGAAAYPSASMVSLSGEPIATFSGHVPVLLPFEVAPKSPVGSHDVLVSVRYQACSGDRCLSPRTDVVRASVVIAAR